jgi:hypothetical protein
MAVKLSRDIVDGLAALESEFKKNAQANPVKGKPWDDRARLIRIAINEIEHLRKFAPKDDH